MKQVIVIIKGLKMDSGKACSQVAHASVEAVLKSDKKKVEVWKRGGMKKAVLKVETEKELLELKKKAESLKLVTALIRDAGRTFFKKPTVTCLAIGPDSEEKVDKVASKLKLL